MKRFGKFSIGTGVALVLASAHAADVAPPPPTEVIESPYDACKGVVMVSKDKFNKNTAEWRAWEAKCSVKVQILDEAGFTQGDPKAVTEGAEYFNFASTVAEHVLTNLEKSRKYADCSLKCFSGQKSCEADGSDPSVNCEDRRKEVLSGMKVQSRYLRQQLALTQGTTAVNVQTVLGLSDDQRMNKEMKDFEIESPNPVGGTAMQDREIEKAKDTLNFERAALEAEYKGHIAAGKAKDTPDFYRAWMSTKLMQLQEKHQERYREIVYSEAPILSVVEKPKSWKDGDPVWTDEQLAKAFSQLVSNAEKTKAKVKSSVDGGKLEFGRMNGESLKNWFVNFMPGTTDRHDLLYYMGMKNQVEEILKGDPSKCGIATTLAQRLSSKELQNAAVTFAGTFATGGLTKGASAVTTNVFRVGRALSGAESAGLAGMAMGSTFLGDSFKRYSSVSSEAASRSGLGSEEGSSFRSGAEVSAAQSNVAMNLAFAPTFAPGSWALGKSLYNALGAQMGKDLPEIAALMKKAGTSDVARDQAVDKWLAARLEKAIKGGIIDKQDVAEFKGEAGSKIMNDLAADITKSNPKFFHDPKNFDFFLETAATSLRKRPGDPSDLGVKAKHLFVSFSPEAFQDWDPRARQGLMKVFNQAVEELRSAYKNDPVAYAKLQSDPAAQEKIMLGALKRSGVVDEKEAQAMFRCALPQGGAAL